MRSKKSGQILILVLLIVVVSLAVGLSVASRNLTNLKTATQTEQSQRAFTSAEGGVEDVLSRLNTIANDIKVGSTTSGCAITVGVEANCSVPVGTGGIIATVNVKAVSTYERTIDLGDVSQINLASSSVAKARIEWSKIGDTNEVDSLGPASIEAIEVYGASPYSQRRWAYSAASRSPDEQGLTAVTCSGAVDYRCSTTITMDASPQLLRVKPFWVKTTVRVTGLDAGGTPITLPVQSYDVISTATTEFGLTRKVQVTRYALPQLPAVFDFALYSESDIIK